MKLRRRIQFPTSQQNKSEVKAESVKQISGKFKLLPLTAEWPATLTSWFGAPGAPAKVRPRYFHS